MAIYEGLIIPRSYNAYINKSSPQDLYNMINNHNMAAGIVSASNKLVTESSAGVAQIEKLIPPQASEENQLADKDFVNSSISTNTANYIYKTSSSGEKVPFDSVSELEAYSGTVTQNDYAFVTGTDESGNIYFDRYKANVSGEVVTWAKEYRQNNSGFTSDQWGAIMSGITTEKVGQYDKLLNIIDDNTEDTTHGWSGSKIAEEIGEDRVIENGHNANGYYRKWKSGYIEQWGHYAHDNVEKDVIIQFPFSFSDIDYNLQITNELDNQPEQNCYYQYTASYKTKSLNGFNRRMTTNHRLKGFDWFAKGF